MNTPDDDIKPQAQPAFSGVPPQPPRTAAAGMAGDSDDSERKRRLFEKEREEVLKFRASESARLGYDIGFEKALLTWIVEHRRKWMKENA